LLVDGDGAETPGYIAPGKLGEDGDCVAEKRCAVVDRPQGLLTCGRLEAVAEKLRVEKGELGTPPVAVVAAGFWP
jgi:hypothetical protein